MHHDSSPTHPFTAYALLLVAPLCWAGNIVLARGVFEMIPPVAFAFWRWVLALALLLPFTWRTARKDWPMVVAHWKVMVVISFFGISVFNTLLYTAVHTTTAVNGALIQTTMPATIILMVLVLYREKISRIQLLGVVVCIAGAGLVVLRGKLSALTSLTFVQGDLLMVVAVVCYALYSALLRKRPPVQMLSFLVYTFGIGAIGLIPLYGWELATVGGFFLTPKVGFSILYVAAFPSILSYFCWNRGIDMIGPSRGGLFINLVPVFASIMAVWFLGETLEVFHGLSLAMIVGGMVLFNR